MSLLAALTLKVSAILLVALIGAACLRTRSASARHWVLAIGVVLASVDMSSGCLIVANTRTEPGNRWAIAFKLATSSVRKESLPKLFASPNTISVTEF